MVCYRKFTYLAWTCQGAYTDAQEAAIAAYNAAEDAKQAAQDARRFADQVPRPEESASPDDMEDVIDTEEVDGVPQYPPKSFAGKSQQELQEQYDAAAGPPEKKLEEASAPPADTHDLEMPDVPGGTSGALDVDDLPGVDHLPGPKNTQAPSDELDELNKRFEILKKR